MIPGQGKLNKFYNNRKAKRSKESFYKFLLQDISPNLDKPTVDITLACFSGQGETSDQMLSIYSFVKNVGVPRSWKIISDGNHIEETRKFFKRFPFVEFTEWSNEIAPEYRELISECPTWQVKKLFTFCSLKISSTTIFLDSDILFFPNFKTGLDSLRKYNWYMADTSAHFDEEFNPSSGYNYLNGGFLVLNQQPDVRGCIDYYMQKVKTNTVGYFTDQTAMQLMVQQNDFRFLDPRFFCLSVEDMFGLNSKIDTTPLAVRHYVGQVRFRMWEEGHKQKFFI
ncbi:MAG TPA: hypothetical protein PL009_00405 [Flavipsychrobacter sp.]|nr:hypothetical protein [Flavipsychrobacter sp.]